VIGVTAVAVTWGLVALSLALLFWTFCRTTRWRATAHKLARQVDLALPGHLEPVVMRYVRNQWAVGTVLGGGAAFLLSLALRAHPGGSTSSAFTWSGALFALAGYPLLILLAIVVPASIVRWRARGSVRLAHVQRLSVDDVTNLPERVVALAFVVASCAVSALGYWRAAPSARAWTWVAPASVLLVAAGGWWYARATLAGRSSGSDVLELAWDDALRVQRARDALIVTTAFVLPMEIVFAWLMQPPTETTLPSGAVVTGSSTGPWLTPFVLLVVGIVWYAAKGNPGARRAWRRLWPPPDPVLPPPPAV
jgi:hypothetical protein